MKRFFEVSATKNIHKKCVAVKYNALRIFSVAHQYPWRVAPQQSSLPFSRGWAKLISDLYVYKLS